ncbi:SMC-Scp complex subunit ScpB [Actinoplanes sp. CA-142083]|uniref:SMC-Scp complex subunit ScpB n=1 Tax=Actinoplanes sp. CA-142083 TaxID=3239903 RepID=UPI003D90A79E
MGDQPVSVDQPLANGDEPEPTAGEVGPELPLPEAVEDAVEEAEDEGGQPADAPLPVDGDDAGDVFDQAADDDVSDDGVDDLPFGDGEDAGEDDLDEGAGSSGDVADEKGPLSTLPAAGELGAAGRSANAVPEQGRRRKDPAAAVEDSGSRTDNDLPELTDDGELAAALEAILLVVDEPVAEMQLAQILEQPTERVGAMLEDISARYTAAGHGFDLRRAAGGWRLYTRPEYAAYVERFVLDGQSVRLTQAALETLAVVAYKQPVTRSRISAIRGVNCDGVMRTLVTRGLIEECGIEGETGAHLYRTTPLFLEKLGLNSVDQLPPLAPFLPDDVEEVLDAPG